MLRNPAAGEGETPEIDNPFSPVASQRDKPIRGVRCPMSNS